LFTVFCAHWFEVTDFLQLNIAGDEETSERWLNNHCSYLGLVQHLIRAIAR
jgi:hypothetical protein